MNDGTHRIEFTPGYNHRDRKGGGVHGMEIRFLLVAERGAVQFVMNTGWVPGEKMSPSLAGYFPTGYDLGYHWPVKQYAEQYESACDVLPQGSCFTDGSMSNADPIVERFVCDGEDGVWDELDAYYRRLVDRETDWLAEALT